MRLEESSGITCCAPTATSDDSADSITSMLLPTLQEVEEDTALVEETFLWNDPEAFTELSSTFLADDDDETVWNLSIVYSDTWQVPVLYFTVEWRTHGQPCTRTEIGQLLRHVVVVDPQEPTEHNDDDDDDDWLSEDFVSATEHPIHGTPCYFLHPCQTAERLRMMMIVVCHDRENENVAKRTSHSVQDNDTSSALHLWSWFSLILPALGFSIPPHLFLQVRNRLTVNQTPENIHKSNF